MRRSVASQDNPFEPILGSIRHGSHFCAFYETEDDLLSLVLPFCEAGALRGDLCIWMMPDGGQVNAPAGACAALERRGVELHPARELYKRQEDFASGPVVDFWNTKLDEALGDRKAGLSATGDTCWLQQRDWHAFMAYENELNDVIADRPIAVLCTYPLSASKAGDLYDVVRAHQVTLTKRGNEWAVLEAQSTDRNADALEAADRVASLSPRERQVLNGVADGQVSKVMAFELGLSVRTIELHRERAMKRLGVRTMAEAVRLVTQATFASDPVVSVLQH